MKKILLLISATLLINGCTNKPQPQVVVPPVKQKCLFPKLPVYQIPSKKTMTTPIHIEGDKYAVIGSELKDLLLVNAKLRKTCDKYAYVNQKVNEEYNK